MISIDKIVQSMWCEMVYKYTNAPAQAHLHTRIFGADFRITCSWLFTNIVQCSQVFMYLHKSTSSLRLTTERQMEKNQSNHRTKELVEKKWNDKVHTRVRQRKFYPWKLSALNGEFGCNKRTFWFIHINNFFLYFSKAQENARTPESFRFCLCTKTSIFFYFCHKANP